MSRSSQPNDEDVPNTIPTVEIDYASDKNVPSNQPSGQKPTSLQLNSSFQPQNSNTVSENPYHYIQSYSHEATTVPPYVLYGIANKERSDSKFAEKPTIVGNLVKDPFISSLNNNWATFFHTVDSTPAYTRGILNHDKEALAPLPDLSGQWGGDQRLRHFLNNESTDFSSHSHQEKKRWWSQNASSGDSTLNDHAEGTRSRSKADYWMSTEKRDELKPFLKRVFLYNNYVPLFFRISIVILSVAALALSANIYRLSKKKVQLSNSDLGEVTQQPSTIMAICVQSIALVYLFYITYDEFSSKPLGIRNPLEKMRLILLDLLFIIFSSANLSLSFNTLYDSRWVCSLDEYSRYPKVESICANQKALAAFLFIILTMWVITFSISMTRVIQKVSSPGS